MAKGKQLSADLLSEQADLLDRSIEMLKRLREVAYEGLNQLQHEYACLDMVRRLKAAVPGGKKMDWHWHPSAGNDPKEADVIGYLRGKPIVQAEVTTSREPKGVIDARLGKKIQALGLLPGKYRFYGVATEKMAARARHWADVKRVKLEVIVLDQAEGARRV